VPDTWDPVVYRERAKARRDKAAALRENDPGRAHCLEIAEGYARLATFLEQRCKPGQRSAGQ
jgi:hypothetical protein